MEEGEANGTSESNSTVEETSQNLTFLEAPSGYTVGSKAECPAEALTDESHGVSLGDFLSRPVQIASFTWNESDSVGTTHSYSPWQLYFSNSVIQHKLNNYAFLRCDLKVKIMVNASPFYYGAMIAAYQPLPAFKPSTIITDAGNRHLILYSQQPHAWIYPQNNEGGEITLPFFLPVNWINIGLNQDFLNMGTLRFINYTTLQSANSASTGVVVTVYAWAENVVVSGPTCGLAMQAKDEYGKGPVSSVASAVATAARALSKIPIIGPYATATQVGASAIAQVASYLGFSNPPVIDDAMPFRSMPFPVLASAEQSYPIEKLTIDPKNELTVDPRVTGLPPTDELEITNLVTKESYLTQTSWSSSQGVDTILFSSTVSPSLFDCNAVTNAVNYLTPMCWVSQLFQYWRGDIIFRFKFIATQYHRGRVRIIYDPAGTSGTNVLNTVGTQASCFNEVVDLTKDTNVEIRVPYRQYLAWLRPPPIGTQSSIWWSIGTTPSFNHVLGQTNGTIVMRVVTGLTGPTSSASIPIMVSVRAAENFELAMPTDPQQNFSVFVSQSLTEYDASPSVEVIAGNAPSTSAPSRFLVNFGENVVTLRQLLRRYSLTACHVNNVSVTNSNFMTVWINFSPMPPFPGFDPGGLGDAKGLTATTTTFPYNWTINTPLLWLASAFIGRRGSLNHTFNVDKYSIPRNITVNRVSGGVNPAAINFDNNGTTYVGPSTSADNILFAGSNPARSTAAGASVTNGTTQAGLNVQLPMYSAYKFITTDPLNSTVYNGQDDSQYNSYVLTVDMSQIDAASTAVIKIFQHVAIGTDFSLHFFLNVPTLVRYASQPVPVD